jgi:DNA-binding response OmpR family regulator
MSGPGPARILVVDDDDVFRAYLRSLLEREGHAVVEAPTGEDALTLLVDERPDLLVLDIEMPGMSGLELLNRLRNEARVPAIVVSGHDAECERVLGLDLGADDYVVKPFLAREFAARVRSVLRRAQPSSVESLRFGVLEIRLPSRDVVIDGRPVQLTPREFDVLSYLAARPGQVVGRQQLLQDVWKSSEEWQDPATVTEHIRRLRHKIERDPANPRWLRAVRNVGYSFEPE